MNDNNWARQIDPPPEKKFVERTMLKDDPDWLAMKYLSIAACVLMLLGVWAWDYIEKNSDPCDHGGCEMYRNP
jgi:hypothetical protein